MVTKDQIDLLTYTVNTAKTMELPVSIEVLLEIAPELVPPATKKVYDESPAHVQQRLPATVRLVDLKPKLEAFGSKSPAPAAKPKKAEAVAGK